MELSYMAVFCHVVAFYFYFYFLPVVKKDIEISSSYFFRCNISRLMLAS